MKYSLFQYILLMWVRLPAILVRSMSHEQCSSPSCTEVLHCQVSRYASLQSQGLTRAILPEGRGIVVMVNDAKLSPTTGQHAGWEYNPAWAGAAPFRFCRKHRRSCCTQTPSAAFSAHIYGLRGVALQYSIEAP